MPEQRNRFSLAGVSLGATDREKFSIDPENPSAAPVGPRRVCEAGE
jgi:hypothetical protein